MPKRFAFLSFSIALLSMSLIVLLVIGFRQRQIAAAPPAETRPALVVAPTRALSSVVIAPTATEPPLVQLAQPTPAASPTEMVPLAPESDDGAPRVIMLLNNVQSQFRLSNYCAGFGSPISLRLFDWATGSTVSLSNAAIAGVPLGWDASNSIWRGYQSAKPFDQPDDVSTRWKINLFLPDGRERWIDIAASPQTPDQFYVYSFQRTDPFADSQGQHYGIHPCRAFALPVSEVESFLTKIDQFQDAVRYPALLTSDDSRWIQGIAHPTGVHADLRSIPTSDYNNPIGSIDQPVALWYARDPAWGSWAQVKMGLVQGWVDTGLVSLMPEG